MVSTACPYDTDGDGNCGQYACPYCGVGRLSEQEYTSNSELLSELRRSIAEQPRVRLHVHPDAVVWVLVSVANMGLSAYVQVVADPRCKDVGKGRIETQTHEQWRALRSLVGHQVALTTSDLPGVQTGTLTALTHGEAQLDLGDGDIRYLSWLTIEPASGD